MEARELVFKMIDTITILLGLYLICVFPFSVSWYEAIPVGLIGIGMIISGLHFLGDSKEEKA